MPVSLCTTTIARSVGTIKGNVALITLSGTSTRSSWSNVPGCPSSNDETAFRATTVPNGDNFMDTASKITIVPVTGVGENLLPVPVQVDPVIEETPPIPESCAEDCETVEAMKLFYKNDFEAIAEDFIKEHYTDGDHRLVHFFDGHLHCYNGRCYEKQTNTIFPQLYRSRLKIPLA